MDVLQLIDQLQLQPHPEGGYYKQTYRSNETVQLANGQIRHLSTSILFLLTPQSPSHFHQLTSDEIWYYHQGVPLSVHMLLPNGNYQCIKMGIGKECFVQYTVPKGTIFGSSVESIDEKAYSLVSCSVTPGFTFEDFKLFTQDELLAIYPKHKDIIKKLAYSSKTY